jgi:SPP1 gp7 family putative phage head morphogenesis protein
MGKRRGRARPRPHAARRPSAANRQAQPALRKAGSTYEGTTPAPVAAALHRQGMDTTGTLSPGSPLRPYFGYSQRPRAMDYRVGTNITTSGRAAWGRVSWDTIRGIIGAWDTARACINHKIDELRGMELQFQPADGVTGNVDAALDAARAALAYPDRDLPYESWFSKWMENALKYDWAPLHRRRNMAGEVIGLEVLDGTTISPFIDEHGRKPQAPAPAYFQSVHGMVADWLTDDDVFVAPFRPQEDSRYGLAPIESLLITANTSIRFQWHMLQMFTEGSIPAGFMEAPPDLSSPKQVEEWQDFWDAVVLGDQAKQRQLQWVPAGSKFTGTKPDAFDKEFPKYLDLRCAALFGVVGQDINITDDVNRSTGEVQTDTQFRVNTLPWVIYVNGTLTRYLQYDLRLPVKVTLKTGREKADELVEAQTHQIYVQIGAESPDEVRSDVLNKPVDLERPWPRAYYTPRTGPIPQLAIEGMSGRIDPETYGPSASQPIVYEPFAAAPGAVPAMNTADAQTSLATEDAYQTKLRSSLAAEGAQAPVVKGGDVRTAELAAFSRFVKARQRAGKWRDFQFTALDPQTAAYLNSQAREQVAPVVLKADAAVPGLTKRSGMISLDLPVGAVEPVPGGVDDHHITVVYLGSDVDDEAFAAACARAQAAAAAMPGPLAVTVGGLDTFEPSNGSGGTIPAFAPVDAPAELYTLRSLLADLSASEHTDYHPHVTLAYLGDGDALPRPVPDTPVTFTQLSVHRGGQIVSFPLGGAVAKVAGDPKAGSPQDGEPAQSWPGWQLDLDAAAYWAPLIASGLLDAVAVRALVRAYLADHPQAAAAAEGRSADEVARELRAEAIDWVARERDAIEAALGRVLEGVWTDGYLIGATSATAAVETLEAGLPLDTAVADVGTWAAGDTEAARLLLGQAGDGSGLAELLDEFQITIKSIASSRLDELGRALAEGAARGDSADTIADNITALLSNPSRAQMIATTELARAVSAAAVAHYEARGYREIEWLTAEDDRVCPICGGNEDAGPVRIGEMFPSGVPRPPGHPWCRCAAQVVISSRQGGGGG